MLQARRSRFRFPMRSFDFQLNYPFSCTMVLESTQPLTQMSTRKLLGGKGRAARKTDNLIVICEPIAYKMFQPRRLATLWASKFCYGDSVTAYGFSIVYLDVSLFLYFYDFQCIVIYVRPIVKERPIPKPFTLITRNWQICTPTYSTN
jgi:hypothetical protein